MGQDSLKKLGLLLYNFFPSHQILCFILKLFFQPRAEAVVC